MRQRKRILIGCALVMCAAFLPTPAAVAESVHCATDGTSGERVQAVYARTTDVPADRALIPQMAAIVDEAFVQSAARSFAGSAAHPRWACVGGVLSIIDVALPAGWDGSLFTLKAAMRAHSGNLLDDPDRKYLVWAGEDGNCFVADGPFDDRASPALNAHNTQTGGMESAVGMATRGCWDDNDPFLGGLNVSWGTQHELMHTLGAVNNSAPHAYFGHTFESLEAMSLDKPGFTAVRCGDPNSFASFAANQPLFDCGHDDYFSAAPDCGNYLATHWNTFNSSFVVRQNHPATQTCQPAARSKKTDRTPSFTLYATRPVTGFTCVVDGRPPVACASPFTTPKLKPGSHRLEVTATTDFEGRPADGPAVKTFKIARKRR